MKVLILGGTVFLGRHLLTAALARGHEVTIFHRGDHEPEDMHAVEHLHGDRTESLAALGNRRWDAVIDTSGMIPRIVKLSAEALADHVDHYTFISSISTYAESSLHIIGLDEQAPLGALEDEAVEEITGDTYGPLKALSERAVEEALPGRTLIVRPGLIVGPYDPTDRFTYWPHRVAQGGEVLAPGRPERQIQFIDVRDLAEWIVRMVEARATGVYNATGPDNVLTMGRLLDECKAVSGSNARFTWVSEAFLAQEQVGEWMELPLWLAETPEMAGFMAVSCAKAQAAGLTYRPLAETVGATLDWDATRPTDTERSAGLRADRERDLLMAWHARDNA